MTIDPGPSERQAWFEALADDLPRQLARVKVDLREAQPQMREIASLIERPHSPAATEVLHSLDLTGIVIALRGLPDGAGIQAFVAAYNARPVNPDDAAS